jgi:hypothetical protein
MSLPFNCPKVANTLTRWAPFLIPPLYLLLALWLQPADQLGKSDRGVRLGRLVYDDYDMTAMALRGLNSAHGRIAGRSDEPCPNPEEFDRALDEPRPLHPRYFLEYPHAALLIFRLGFMGYHPTDAPPVPAAVSDGCQHVLVTHRPRDTQERALWGQLRRAIRIYECMMVACLVGLMAVLRAGYFREPPLAGPWALLVLPGTLYFTVNRFDIVPTLLTVMSLLSLSRGRLAASALALAVASLLKVYPVLLVPLVLGHVWADRRRAIAWLAVYASTVLAALAVQIALSDPTAVAAPYRYQFTRPAEFGWTFYGIIVPESLATRPVGKVLRLSFLAATVLGLALRRLDGLPGLVRRGAIVLIVFISTQVFFSPQWILWLSPLLIPLARVHPAIPRLIVLLDVVSYSSFPVVFDWPEVPAKQIVRISLIVARGAILAALLVVLLRAEFSFRSWGVSRKPGRGASGQEPGRSLCRFSRL